MAENHIILLEQVVDRPVLEPAQLAAVLRSKPIDQLFRCISGAANVSVFELSQLPLPDPNVLVEELKRHPDIDSAVLNAFYRTINSGYSRVREWLKTKDCSSMIKFFGRIDVKQQRHVENRPIHEAEACTRTEP